MSLVRVVLVDDHGIVRQGLRSILDPDPQFEVVGEAANGAEALRIVRQRQPDFVLLDLQLPDMGGVEICKRIVQISPETTVLILTAFIDRHLVSACLQAVAKGYLLKDADTLDLREQLLRAVHGHSAMDTRAVDLLAESIRSREPLPEQLNLREMEVLRLIAKGLTNKEIGATLHLSENTVKWYVKGILTKMDAQNRTQAALLGQERGLLQGPI